MDMIIGRTVIRYSGFILKQTHGILPTVSLTPVRCLCHYDIVRRNVKVYDKNVRYNSNYLVRSNSITSKIILQKYFVNNGATVKTYSTDKPLQPNKDCYEPLSLEKQTVFQKMKQMAKDYWHILIPVHVVTSIGWMSMFYFAAKNGVDIVSILESLNLSERYLEMMRGSTAGHWAVAYALYKIFTPIRYTVTVGGTTMAIRYLNRLGYLKFKPRSTIKETQSAKCAEDHREKFAKTGFKSQQQTEPPKT